MSTSEDLADPKLLPRSAPVKTTRSTASQFHRVEVDGEIMISFVPIKGALEVTVHLYNGMKGDLKTVVNGDVLVISDARRNYTMSSTSLAVKTAIGNMTVYGNVVIGSNSTQINYGREQAYSRKEAQQPLRVVVLLPPELNIKICDDFDGAVGITDDMTEGIVSVKRGLDITMRGGELIHR